MKLQVIGCLAAATIIAAPAFEVAAIRPASLPTPDTFRTGQFHAGLQVDGARFDWGFASLSDLLPYAFRVKNYQVAGPEWMNQSRWNILARLPEGASPDTAPEMVQALLVDRFKLKIHHETRDQPVYELVLINKDGPKMETDAMPDPAAVSAGAGLPGGLPFGPGRGPGGPGGPGGPQQVQDGRGGRGPEGPEFATSGMDGSTARISPGDGCALHLELSKLTMQAFADTLSPFVDRPVIDATGLKGAYKANLDLPIEVLFGMMQNMMRTNGLPGLGQGGFGPGGRGPGDGGRGPDGGGRGGFLAGCPDPGAAFANAGDASNAPIFQAVQKLGLKLQAKKAPFDTIVVDHIEKAPSEN